MTREEAIEILKNGTMFKPTLENKQYLDAFDLAIKALEHPEKNVVAIVPCGDAISRQAVEDAMYDATRAMDLNFGQIMEYIDKLPSVVRENRTGQWIKRFDESGKWYECDQCHTDWGGSVNYCPNCGADMRGDVK